MRRVIGCVLGALLLLAPGLGVQSSASADPGASPVSFSVAIPFTKEVTCPGIECVGRGSLMPYGTASAVLEGSGFDFNTWVVTLTGPTGSLVLDMSWAGPSTCTTPGGSGDIPRPPTSKDFGNPVSCIVTFTVNGGTGVFTDASGSLPGTFNFAGTVLTLAGRGQVSVG